MGTTAEEEITEDKEQIESLSLGQRLRSPKTWLSFGLALAIVVFFVTRLDIDIAATWGHMQSANVLLLATGFVLYYLSFYVRGLRWRQFLVNAGFNQENGARLPSVLGLVEIIFLSWFVNCIVPAKLGDAYRGYLMKKNGAHSFSKTFGTILAERVVDMLILFALMSVAGLVAFHGKVPSSVSYVFLLGLLFAIAIAAGMLALRNLNSWLIRIVPRRFESIYGLFRDGALQSFRRRSIPAVLALTGAVWLLEGARLYFVASSLDVQIGISFVVFVSLAASLLTTIPFTPAGLGAVESAIIIALLWAGIDKDVAGSIAILDRVVSYWSIIVIGVVVYFFSSRK